MKCPICGREMREEQVKGGFGSERGELPPPITQFTCMDEKCSEYNIPKRKEQL